MSSIAMTAAQRGGGFILTPGQSATYAVTGSYTGNVILEKRGEDGGWDIEATSDDDAAMDGTITNPVENNEPRAYFQFRGEVDTGTATGTITGVSSDVVLPNKTVVHPDGTVLLQFRDDGVVIPRMAPSGVIHGIGAPAGALVTVEESGAHPMHRTVLTLTAQLITLTDDAAVGQYGSVKIYDFPAGNIKILGAVIDAVLTLDDALWTDTAVGDVALGSAAVDDADALDGLFVDILASTAIAAMTAQVGDIDAQSLADVVPLGSAGGTDDDLYLNIRIDDAAAHVTDTASTITGTVTISWLNLGDS